MSDYRLLSDVAGEPRRSRVLSGTSLSSPGLGLEFLNEIGAAYERILDGPFKYEELRSGIRRAQTRRLYRSKNSQLHWMVDFVHILFAGFLAQALQAHNDKV